MPLVINPTWVSNEILYAADLGTIAAALEAYLNTGQINDSNVVPNSLIENNLALPVRNVLVKPGMIQEWYGAALPTGYLWCDGSNYTVTAYPALYAAILTTYGGTVAVNFDVPDRRGRVAAGRDDMGGVAANRLTLGVSGTDPTIIGANGGDENLTAHTHAVTATVDAESAHTHTLVDPQHTHATISQIDPASPTTPVTFPRQYRNVTQGRDAAGIAFVHPSELYPATLSGTTGGSVVHQHQLTGTTDPAGTNPNPSTIQPGRVCNYIIKT